MLPKERVQAAFEHRPSDQVPIYQAGLSSYAGSYVLGREAYVGGGIQQYREAVALWNGAEAHREYLHRSRQDAFDLADVLDLDLIRPTYWRLNRQPTRRIDEVTFFYGEEDSGWEVMRFDPRTELYQIADRAPRPEPTFDDLERSVAAGEAHTTPPDLTANDTYKELQAAIERFGATRAIPGHGVGCGIPRDPVWLEATILCPELVGRYLDLQTRHVEVQVQAMTGLGLRYLCGGGDFAGPLGPMYSPKVFHDLMLPRLQRISKICHQYDACHGFASDGNLWSLADDLFGASGVDFFYELDRKAGMDLQRMRETFPRLTLWGGINSETLHLGSVEDVRIETETALEVAKEYGGMIVGCSNQIVAGTPYANIDVMMETLHTCR